MDQIIQITKTEVVNRYRPIDKFTHKGIQGHVLIIGGSFGKIGSVCLSGKAALRTGCGLVTVLVPKCGYEIVQTSVPEMMAICSGTDHISDMSYSIVTEAVAVGSGMGTHPETVTAFEKFLEKQSISLVIDADALNILSANKSMFEKVPANSILTPHIKELERMIGEWKNEKEMFDKVLSFSQRHQVVVVVKGVPTVVVYQGKRYENSSGNAALATGGSGDVLTGIIASLRAQGYPPLDAAIVGVYLHGHTADLALPETGYHSFIASDIISNLGRAWLSLTSL